MISINPAPSPFSLNPSWYNPYYQFNSFNGQGSSGSLNIAAVATLGMWAWAEAYDVFNTAALTGQQVSTAVRGVLVRSYGALDASVGDDVSACGLPDGTSAATTALGSAVCMVHVNAVNSAPAKGLAVTVSLSAGTQVEPSAQVSSH